MKGGTTHVVAKGPFVEIYTKVSSYVCVLSSVLAYGIAQKWSLLFNCCLL